MGPATLVIGSALLLGATICTELAISHGGYYFLLGWPAASMSLLSLGYFYAGPCVAGKRDDGQRQWWAWIIHAPYLLVQSIVWRLNRRLRPELPWCQVAPGVYLGRRVLCAEELPHDTCLVVDLAAEYVEPREIVERFVYRSLPTLDGTSLTTDLYASIVGEVARCDAPIYIHCAVGHGRSAMFAASLLIQRGLARDIEESVAMMKRIRPRVHLRPSHKRLVASCMKPDLSA